MPGTDAILQDQDGRPALRFERVLAHPPEKVWRALTDPGEQSSWHPTPARFEPEVGGTVEYVSGGDVPGMPAGEVTDFEPPRLLGHTWDGDHLLWELWPHDDGCLLKLTHTFDDRFKAARDAAGWHVCLDALATSLGGGPGRPRPEADQVPADWKELNTAYEHSFGIPHEKATPPPNR